MEKSKEQMIKTEYNRMKRLYKEIPENKKILVDKLIQNAAYMSVTLKELQDIVNREGAVITGKNGNGFITSLEHPAQKNYNTLINRYSSTIKQLTELLPECHTQNSKLDEFLRADD